MRAGCWACAAGATISCFLTTLASRLAPRIAHGAVPCDAQYRLGILHSDPRHSDHPFDRHEQQPGDDRRRERFGSLYRCLGGDAGSCQAGMHQRIVTAQ
jgi:hypothetical protein